MRGVLAALVLTGCDAIWRLDPVLLDAPVDAPGDLADPVLDATVDASGLLTCATSPITLLPSGDLQAAWSEQVPATGAHADKVADLVADDDASYLTTKADGEFDFYSHPPISPDVQVDSVTFWVRARLGAPVTQPVQVAVGWRANGITGWDDVPITDMWADYASVAYITVPDTMTPWTVEIVNAMALGVRKSYSEPVRVTRVWATITCR